MLGAWGEKIQARYLENVATAGGGSTQQKVLLAGKKAYQKAMLPSLCVVRIRQFPLSLATKC